MCRPIIYCRPILVDRTILVCSSEIIVYGHVHILWTYQEAKIQFWLLDNFWPDCVALTWLM